MSQTSEQPQKAVPAQLGFLAIYNPSLGTTDETLENQIVYYSSAESRSAIPRNQLDTKAIQDAIREQNNEQLRQIGLAQGMVEFGRSFSDGRSVDTIETEKSRIVLHELEVGWWILASIDLTILPAKSKATGGKEENGSVEYSSREVKPAILLLGDLLQAHSTFLLHHASSMSALFVRTRRSKFIGQLGRFWDMFLSTWNVLMHGNPASSLYGGIKIAACGELGMGVGEEERGSGEREVLEGFIGRIDGLVDVIVSRFGDGDSNDVAETGTKPGQRHTSPTEPWFGSGEDIAAEDGVVFLGSGALSRKSLRDLSHWIEDIYRWGSQAYGVADNPTSNRRSRKAKGKQKSERRPVAEQDSLQGHSLTLRGKPRRGSSANTQDSLNMVPPTPVVEEGAERQNTAKRRPSLRRGPSSYGSTDSESKTTTKFAQYLKFGYGTHWSLGGSTKSHDSVEPLPSTISNSEVKESSSQDTAGKPTNRTNPSKNTRGHYLVGLLGDVDEDDEEQHEDLNDHVSPGTSEIETSNERLLLRTVTVELEREEDARAENEISIDLGGTENDTHSSKAAGSEHTNTSVTSYESQDRNKTKKLRVVVYVNKPFIFVLLFELRTDALALAGLYKSLHHQIGPLIKPLLLSTSYRASRPEVSPISHEDSGTPIYDLIFDPKLLTINSTIPNIPSPYHAHFNSQPQQPWSRLEALNTHMQIINTYIASTTERSEMERTCKTSRGWWVVYCRIPDLDAPTASLASGTVNIPSVIAEDSINSEETIRPPTSSSPSRDKSTIGGSMTSGPAHPFLEVTSYGHDSAPKEKEIFLIRRASDHVATKTSRFISGQSTSSDAGWAAGPGKLVQGIGVDTKRYIESLLNLNR